MFRWNTLSDSFLSILFLIVVHGITILLGIDTNGSPMGQDHMLTKRGTERIFGGDEAIPHEFPMIARIDLNGHRRCAGTILNSHWILTAAYCMVWPIGHWPLENFTVYVGDHNVSVVEKGEQKFRVVESLLHELFRSVKAFDFNLAVIRVEPAIKFSKTVTPVNLPECKKPPGIVEGWAAGWGSYQFFYGQLHNHSDVLRKSKLKTLSREKCIEEDYGLKVNKYTFCTGREGGPCYEDTGAPLLVKDESSERYVQIGIVCARENPDPSLRANCNESVVYYTTVSYYVGWIHRRISGCGNFRVHPYFRPEIPWTPKPIPTRSTKAPQ